MNETIVRDDVAPLGLGFEMPETVWLWEFPDGTNLARVFGGEWLRCAGVSARAITAVVFAYGDAILEDGVRLSSGYPVMVTFDEALASVRTNVGILLADDAGNEITRVYTR